MIRILIADDEAIERRYLSALFSRHPHNFRVVGESRNGGEVMEQAAQTRPDVIIMDINMPGMDGLSSARQIRNMLPDVIILLNTAYAEFEFARKALEYQLDAYLLKPATEDLILTTIENCIRKRQSRASIPSARIAAITAGSLRSDMDPITLVTEYIDNNSYLPLSLEELAGIAHFTPTYLSRVFHEKQGMTVTAYITKRRLENAKYMLTHSTMDIQGIACQCGFSSASHFSRVFKQQNGISPLEFRHQYS